MKRSVNIVVLGEARVPLGSGDNVRRVNVVMGDWICEVKVHTAARPSPKQLREL